MPDFVVSLPFHSLTGAWLHDWVGLPWHARVISILLLVLTFVFGTFFLLRGLWFRLTLLRLARRLSAHKNSLTDLLADLSQAFSLDKTLSHLWQEYRHTLHEQKDIDPRTGMQQVVAIRATVPAETFFNAQTLVDSRLRAEFFKHLPGVFTGLGIIGTFLGLIRGLSSFTVSENAEAVRKSLALLLHGVFEAFLVSVAAITLAMGITLIEKWLLSSLYKASEALAHRLDSLFEAGAGEEYLARLVKASEESASQTKILKDALVADLKEILSDLTQQQIKAASIGNEQLGQQIVASLQTGLKDPLDRIASAVQQVGHDQGQAVTKLLTDVLAGFSQRIQDLFGSQITGINQLQQQTIEALQAAVVKLNQVASNIDEAGQRTTEAMAAKVTEALGAMETRQKVMNERMTEFVEQIRNLVRESQSETNQKLQSTLQQLGDKVTETITALQQQMDKASSQHAERESKLVDQTSMVVGNLSEHVQVMVDKVAMASLEFKAAVDAMRTTTADVTTRMNAGAETLHAAAEAFAKAGEGVTGVLAGATITSEKLTQSAGSIVNAVRVLEGIVTDYRANREMLDRMLTELRGMVEVAKKEASLTSDILARIEDAAAKLSQAQIQADAYLEKIGEVIASTHEVFADNMRKTLGEANGQFYEQLSRATALLRQCIEELEISLSAVGTGK